MLAAPGMLIRAYNDFRDTSVPIGAILVSDVTGVGERMICYILRPSGIIISGLAHYSEFKSSGRLIWSQ